MPLTDVTGRGGQPWEAPHRRGLKALKKRIIERVIDRAHSTTGPAPGTAAGRNPPAPAAPSTAPPPRFPAPSRSSATRASASIGPSAKWSTAPAAPGRATNASIPPSNREPITVGRFAVRRSPGRPTATNTREPSAATASNWTATPGPSGGAKRYRTAPAAPSGSRGRSLPAGLQMFPYGTSGCSPTEHHRGTGKQEPPP